MQDKKWIPLYLLATLVVEVILGSAILRLSVGLTPEHALLPDNHALPFTRPILVEINPSFWYLFLAFNSLILPLIVLTISRKDGAIGRDLATRPAAKIHKAIFQYPLGVFMAMGFCMPSLAGDPLDAGLLVGVMAGLTPVFLVIIVTVFLGRTFQPVLDTLYRGLYHPVGKVLLAVAVLFYLLMAIVVMVTLRVQVDGHVPLVLGTFLLAYLPMRIYLHYWGRGSIAGLVLVVAGMVFQQMVLWG
ncbi:MAG: hypothetical protein AAGN35_02130 [Bacteroidota bacterium]